MKGRGFSRAVKLHQIWLDLRILARSKKPTKESVPQLPRGSFQARMLLSSKLRHVAALAVELQPVLTSQTRNKILIRIGLRPAQLVVEMNDGEDDAEFLTQSKQ